MITKSGETFACQIFISVEPLVYAALLSLFSLLVCLLVFFGASGFGFYSWVRGARIGLTTDIGLLEEF